MCSLCPRCSWWRSQCSWCCPEEPPIGFSLQEKNDEDKKLIDEKRQTKPIIKPPTLPSKESVDESISKLVLEEWYHKDASIFEAITLLLWEGNELGAFLVRPRKNPEIPFILSIRTVDKGAPTTKHYAIHCNDDQFYISRSLKLDSVQRLIKAYAKDSENRFKLCERITTPCRRTKSNQLELSKEFRKQYQLNRNEMTLAAEPISKGHFGEVYKGIYQGKLYAVKKLKNNEFSHSEFLKEVSVMKGLNHRNIISLKGICVEDPLLIVLEYMECGSLKDYMKTHTLDNPQKCYLIYQLADGMAYLESQNIVHRDIAARNLLLNEILALKISDFGLSRFMSEKQYYTMLTLETEFPLMWMAPECKDTCKFNSMSDVWSFGITAMEIYTNGKRPYSEMKFISFEHLMLAIKNKYRMPQAPGMPEEIYSIIESTWNAEPKERPTFSALTNSFQQFMDENENFVYDAIVGTKGKV